MKRFSTQYKAKLPTDNHSGVSYGTYLYADSLKDAEKLVEQRNIGEKIFRETEYKVSSDVPPSKLFEDKKYTAALHYTTFLSYVGMKAGVVTVEETLGDRGVVHEIVHFMHSLALSKKRKNDLVYQLDVDRAIPQIIEQLKEFEKKIPGGPREKACEISLDPV
jgi:hypothetical protein